MNQGTCTSIFIALGTLTPTPYFASITKPYKANPPHIISVHLFLVLCKPQANSCTLSNLKLLFIISTHFSKLC